MNLIKFLKKISFGLILFIILFSSLVNLYKEKNNIINKIKKITSISEENSYKNNSYDREYYEMKEKDIYWAKEILNGGYILHFRHAERDKWIDVQMYDALESDLHQNGTDGSRYAENDYFSKAVCLNNRGLIQAKAMSEHINHIKLPVSYVVSSVSCRARQTAEIVFNGYNSLSRLLVHTGPYNENYDDRNQKLKKFYLSLPVSNNGNVIVSAHNSVVRPEIFENDVGINRLELEEGGFFVISIKQKKLILEHEFNNFLDFQRIFFKR